MVQCDEHRSRQQPQRCRIPNIGQRLVIKLALDHIEVVVAHGLVEVLRLVNVMDHRPEHERRIEHDEVPRQARLVLLIELPSRLLRERLARAVLGGPGSVAALLLDLLNARLVPVLLAEHARLGRRREDCGARRGDDYALDGRAVLLRGFEDAGRALDRGDDELVGLDGPEVEGRRGVLDRVDPLDCLVERAFLGAIAY